MHPAKTPCLVYKPHTQRGTRRATSLSTSPSSHAPSTGQSTCHALHLCPKPRRGTFAALARPLPLQLQLRGALLGKARTSYPITAVNAERILLVELQTLGTLYSVPNGTSSRFAPTPGLECLKYN